MRASRSLWGSLAISSMVVAFAGSAQAGEFTVSPPFVDAGGTHIGSPRQVSFSVMNGPGDNTISFVNRTGPSCSDFFLTAPPQSAFPLVFPSGANQTWNANFVPTPGPFGPRECTFLFGDQDTNQDAVTLRGLVLGSSLSLSTSSLLFGSVSLNSTTQRQLVVSNLPTSTESLVFSVMLSGGAGDFTVIAPCVAPQSCTLAPGASQPINVEFSPTTVGTRATTLVVSSNATQTPNQGVQLSGIGASVTPTVPASGPFGLLLLLPALAAIGAGAAPSYFTVF